MLGIGPAGPVAPPPAAVAPFGEVPDPYAAERDAWTALTAVDGLGPVAFAALLARFGTGRGS